MNYLNEIELNRLAPSVFCSEAHEKTSEKYALIPTIDCIRGLKNAGFYPVKAQQSNSRNPDNRAFAKHLIRFRREGMLQVGGNVPEIVLINSHNGLCSYQLRAGIYRMVCTNGLIVGDEMFYRSIRHQGDVISKVVQSATEIIEVIPQALEISEDWKGITLNVEQRKVFAESASLLKWDKEETIIDPERLLRPRRQADTSQDLWTTFNTVQENIIRGGVKYFNADERRRGTTRAVNSVSENSRLNTALWNLTEKMAQLVK